MANRYYSGPQSDHFDGNRFFVPGIDPGDKSLPDVLGWKLKERPAKWPAVLPQPAPVVPPASSGAIRITMIGHASLLVQVSGVNLLVDPVYAERASPLRWAGPRRHTRPGVAMDALPPIHALLVTHNHYDHLDREAIAAIAGRHNAAIYTPLGNDGIIRGNRSGLEITTGDWGSTFEIADGVRAHLVPAYHWSSRSGTDRRMALWAGFWLETSHGGIYLAGDTALRDDGQIFRQMREQFGSPRVAVLPIGAYAPRWFMQTQHTNPAEAVEVMQILGAPQALGVHWGTFQLTDEAWDEPPLLLSDALVEAGIPAEAFPAMRPGDMWMGST